MSGINYCKKRTRELKPWFDLGEKVQKSPHDTYSCMILPFTHPAVFPGCLWRLSTCQGKQGWHPNTSKVSRSAPRLGHSQAWNGLKEIPAKYVNTPQKTNLYLSAQMQTNLLDGNNMVGNSRDACYYLWESNNVGVRFLSHSWACNKPLAFVSTTLSRRMTSVQKQ